MERAEPRPTEDEAQEALRRIQQRLADAAQAAERMMGEATRSAGTPKPPPAGWQAPASEGPSGRGGELEALLAALASLRELIPPDVAERLLAAWRELLLAVRALIDWYLERLQRRAGQPPEVQDIPIQ